MDKVKKYVNLILDKCIDTNCNTLFISYEKALCEEFVLQIEHEAKNRGISDIFLCDQASFLKHDFLINSDINDIKNNSLFNDSIWDEYTKKGASFLIIKTEIPNLMDDIDLEKLDIARKCERNTKKLFLEKQEVDDVFWCIIAYPNELWAKSVFDSDDAYDRLLNLILDACLCNLDNPGLEWDNHLISLNNRCNLLNNLHINYLHYTNDLGTDLYVYLNNNALWASAYSKNNTLVNLPSYEVFTTPDTYKTSGVVYNSKPLVYSGVLIDEFYLKFDNGRVVDFDAKKGRDVLEKILKYDDWSNMLGECALVDYNSFISKTGVIFKTTLFDENASCHLALGAGFPECIKGFDKKSPEEADSVGINKSKNHVDFMIGTKDLKIVANTKTGDIVIFENGNFVL